MQFRAFTLAARACLAVVGTAILPGAHLTCAAAESSHDELVARARQVLSAETFASELGVQDDPSQFARLSDTQLQAKLGEVDRGLQSAQQKHLEATNALKSYETQLVSQGKTTAEKLPRYTDPTGRLAQLRSTATRAGTVHRDYLVARVDLAEELIVRRDPAKLLADEAALQGACREAREWGRDWQIVNQALIEGDPVAWEGARERERMARQQKIQQGQPVIDEPLFPEEGASAAPKKPPGDRPPSVTGKVGEGAPARPDQKTVGRMTPPNVSSVPSTAEAMGGVSIEQVYGPNADPRAVEALEVTEIQKLPEELRTGVPRNIQRTFFYGGYEKMPRDRKAQIRHVFKEYKAQARNEAELQRAFGELYDSAQRNLPVEALSSQVEYNAFCSAAFLLAELTQGAATSVYGRLREQKWEDAYFNVAAQIPEGKKEKVLFIEDIENNQLDLFTWTETKSVVGILGEIRLDTQDEMFEKLVNLRKSSHPGFRHYRKLYSAEVVGTGAAEDEQPSVKEAFEAGAEIGRLARGGKAVEDLMQKTYVKYNKWPDTREAFKRGYREAAQGLID